MNTSLRGLLLLRVLVLDDSANGRIILRTLVLCKGVLETIPTDVVDVDEDEDGAKPGATDDDTDRTSTNTT